jgi:3-oxoacid CoA-transferase
MYLNGQISLELVPQGTLAERIRAHAAGIPAFFTPTGASTAVEQGLIPLRYNEGGFSKGVALPGIPKEVKVINGRRFVLEHSIAGDVAFIRAWKVDESGNCVFRCDLWLFHPAFPNFNMCTIDMRHRTSVRSWLKTQDLQSLR